MELQLMPGELEGKITPPGSKSQSHRAMLGEALAGQPCTLENLAQGEDITCTRTCLEQLTRGCEGTLPLLDCGASGSTLRFLMPASLVLLGGARWTGQKRLMERPMSPYWDLFQEKGIHVHTEDGVLTVEGTLTPGVYSLPGHYSSQFITGLMYALPLLQGESIIRVTTPLESRGYVDLTLEVLQAFGIEIQEQEEGVFVIPGGQTYAPCTMTMEADWSQGAVWYGANFLDHHVQIQGLNPQSKQGDRQIALWYWTLAQPGEVTLDLSQHPDLAPALGAMATVRRGTTHLVHGERLRTKESDRLGAMAQLLTDLGMVVEEREDGISIQEGGGLQGGVTVDSHQDHRIAMMAAILATRCQQPVVLLGAECVNKSYPHFWEDYQRLGGEVNGLIPG